MSWLNLQRLLPTRKIWKLFSTKLQTKFHKVLGKSKVIKKSKKPNSFSKASKKLAPWPVFRVQFKTKGSNKFKHKSKYRSTLKYHKKAAPVYIDQLFIEDVSVVKEKYVQLTAKTANKDIKQVCVMETEQAEIHLGKRSVPSTSMVDENPNDQQQLVAADEMWESLTLASPQLHCINERAEEFIAKFRANMRQQNLLARRL
ncbi:hypothetical protein A4A49_32154 [Nicotiana attenuata]|uniref:Uncharacterized protein n=1 Tax=Nicotiana attenuata TaxID=49451 RepID=A0A1J6JY86_NICAT|nr:hypothetical protein A4A49_32154 [Nicotiana attenuata]